MNHFQRIVPVISGLNDPPFLLKSSTPNHFKNARDFKTRYDESGRILAKYPDRVPTVVEKSEHSHIATMDKTKFLIPKNLTISQFIYIIRKRIRLPPSEALFLFVNNSAPSSNEFMGEIYTRHKDNDGFLYISYTNENTFGS